jgi:hypothetical protein
VPHTNVPLGCCHGLLGVDDLSQPDIHYKMNVCDGTAYDLLRDRHDTATASIKKPIHNVKEQAIHGPRTGYG